MVADMKTDLGSHNQSQMIEQDNLVLVTAPVVKVISDLEHAFERLNIKSMITFPQMIVIGERGVGKSSVIEGLTGTEFMPVGPESVGTRRPLVIDLHYNEEQYAEFFHKQGVKFKTGIEIQGEIEKCMRDVTKDFEVVSEPIFMSMYGPTCPEMTLIDTPGLLKHDEAVKYPEVGACVRDIVHSYIQNDNAFIIPILLADVHPLETETMTCAKEVDPDGCRTLGVITGIDCCGGKLSIDLLLNKVAPLKRGYMGVINRTIDDLAANRGVLECRISEKEFFRHHPAFKNVQSRLGINQLLEFLIKILLQYLMRALHDVHDDIRYEVEKEKDIVDNIVKDTERRVSLILQKIQDFQAAYQNNLRGAESRSASEKETGNWRISRLFKELLDGIKWDYENEPERLKQDVQLAVLNAYHRLGARVSPIVIFDQFLENETLKLYGGALKVVDNIIAKMKNAIENSANCCRTQPKLAEVLENLTLRHLSQLEEPTKRLLEVLVRMEAADTCENPILLEDGHSSSSSHPAEKVGNIEDRNRRQASPYTNRYIASEDVECSPFSPFDNDVHEKSPTVHLEVTEKTYLIKDFDDEKSASQIYEAIEPESPYFGLPLNLKTPTVKERMSDNEDSLASMSLVVERLPDTTISASEIRAKKLSEPITVLEAINFSERSHDDVLLRILSREAEETELLDGSVMKLVKTKAQKAFEEEGAVGLERGDEGQQRVAEVSETVMIVEGDAASSKGKLEATWNDDFKQQEITETVQIQAEEKILSELPEIKEVSSFEIKPKASSRHSTAAILSSKIESEQEEIEALSEERPFIAIKENASSPPKSETIITEVKEETVEVCIDEKKPEEPIELVAMDKKTEITERKAISSVQTKEQRKSGNKEQQKSRRRSSKDVHAKEKQSPRKSHVTAQKEPISEPQPPATDSKRKDSVRASKVVIKEVEIKKEHAPKKEPEEAKERGILVVKDKGNKLEVKDVKEIVEKKKTIIKEKVEKKDKGKEEDELTKTLEEVLSGIKDDKMGDSDSKDPNAILKSGYLLFHKPGMTAPKKFWVKLSIKELIWFTDPKESKMKARVPLEGLKMQEKRVGLLRKWGSLMLTKGNRKTIYKNKTHITISAENHNELETWKKAFMEAGVFSEGTLLKVAKEVKTASQPSSILKRPTSKRSSIGKASPSQASGMPFRGIRSQALSSPSSSFQNMKNTKSPGKIGSGDAKGAKSEKKPLKTPKKSEQKFPSKLGSKVTTKSAPTPVLKTEQKRSPKKSPDEKRFPKAGSRARASSASSSGTRYSSSGSPPSSDKVSSKGRSRYMEKETARADSTSDDEPELILSAETDLTSSSFSPNFSGSPPREYDTDDAATSQEVFSRFAVLHNPIVESDVNEVMNITRHCMKAAVESMKTNVRKAVKFQLVNKSLNFVMNELCNKVKEIDVDDPIDINLGDALGEEKYSKFDGMLICGELIDPRTEVRELLQTHGAAYYAALQDALKSITKAMYELSSDDVEAI